jgi:hypothetical protein
MTSTNRTSSTQPTGRLTAAEDVVAGQYVHVRPLARSALEWCEVRGARRLRRYHLLELTRSDGVEFWWKVPPGHVLRTLDDAPPATTTPESDRARARLRQLFPGTGFRVRPSAGDTVVAWSDGPAVASVMTALATAGVAYPRCDRTCSPRALGAVLVHQARESSLHDAHRFTALCDTLDALTAEDWALGRQLAAFAGDTDDTYELLGTLRRFGLDILAETAGVPSPAALNCCQHCQGTPGFAIRRAGRRDTTLSCAACLGHHHTGGVEITPLPAAP